MNARYVLVALARPRVDWLDRVVQLANSGAVAAEVQKCVGLVDLLSHVGPGKRVSAALLDGGAHGVDRDLIYRIRASGIAVFVVADPHVPHDWTSLGADAVLRREFAPHELLDTLVRSAQLVQHADFEQFATSGDGFTAAPWCGSLVAVIGPGGTGVSTVAIAAAQGLGRGTSIDDDATANVAGSRRARTRAARRSGDHTTALIDLRLCAEQAMLHDADPSAPGLLEVIDACRLGNPDPEAIRAQFTAIPDRCYDLLPGLRRRRLWTQLRPASSLHAVNAILGAYDVVVADLDADTEGEQENGSIDVEERHQLTRLALQHAAVVLVVGHSSMKGMHSLARLLREIVELGVAPDLVQPVFNHAASGSRARAGYTSALSELTDGLEFSASPVFVPTRDIDDRLRALVDFPSAVVDPIHGAIAAHLRRGARRGASDAPAEDRSPRPIAGGFLGRWKAAS